MDTQAMLPLPTAMEDTPEDTMARGQLRLRLRLSMDTTPTLLTDPTTTMDTQPMLPQLTEATLPQPTAMEDTLEDTMARGQLKLSQRLKLMLMLMLSMDTTPTLLTDPTTTMDTQPMLPQ